jgi:putative SOS response-associated peptidase YedK
MCGRMSLSKSHFAEIADELAASFAPALAAAYRPRFNLAPTDPHFILRNNGDRVLEPARWGFAGGPGRPPLFNARAETAATLGTFRNAYAHGRCVVPADGFYEWSGPPDHRQAHWLHRRDGRLLLMAGVQRTEPAGSASGTRFSILTTNANHAVAPLHDRMPVILAPDEIDRWLVGADATLLRPAPDDVLEIRAVSNRVNSVKNDDPGCQTPITAIEAAQGQMRLF